ncbi:DNA-binding protein [Fusobacterium necrophorum subsp. funduliforme]|uniref:helix-turn-helix domain-containing protein n=1 Tax=Fusobacterium necrophorum TaxID=859 RepID=UPI000245DC8E|nr:helix-turn-helix domain-containing protein [Fusobacterium necrophorum]AVQ21344.1 DNA-binding protein [Fusobacterium necrophorum subsp. funduliforme]EHO19795.1 excisionase family DNA binding domain-containing protein [Fusobacterium necrophorum subsp. funduliforme 1_1_36S]
MQKKVVINEQIVYTVAETAKILKVNKNKIYEYINQGILPAINLGTLKITHSAILSFLQKYEGMDLSNLHNIHPIIVNKKEGSYERKC